MLYETGETIKLVFGCETWAESVIEEETIHVGYQFGRCCDCGGGGGDGGGTCIDNCDV